MSSRISRGAAAGGGLAAAAEKGKAAAAAVVGVVAAVVNVVVAAAAVLIVRLGAAAGTAQIAETASKGSERRVRDQKMQKSSNGTTRVQQTQRCVSC